MTTFFKNERSFNDLEMSFVDRFQQIYRFFYHEVFIFSEYQTQTIQPKNSIISNRKLRVAP